MRQILLLMSCLCFSLAAYAQTAKPEVRTASLSGRITIEGKPAAGATVTALSLGVGDANFVITGLTDGESFQAQTDGEGRYEIRQLPKGRYQIKCLSDAYVEQAAAASNRVYSLDEGEARKDLDFALIRGGVITGRVTDADGKPVIEEMVALHPLTADNQPQAKSGNLEDWDEHRRTDDRGSYRAFGLLPGRYRVSVGTNESGSSRYGEDLSLPLTYYPHTTNVAEAKIVEVKAGSEAENIDIRVGRDDRTFFSARGRVVEVESGQPVGNTGVAVDGVRAEENEESANSNSSARVDATGHFRLSRLRAGRYRMRLEAEGGFLDQSSAYYGEPLEFTVADGDVTGLEYKVRRGASISGTAVLEAAAGNDANNKPRLAQMLLFVRPTTNEDASANWNGFNGYTQIKADNSFRFAGVPPGKVTIQSQSFSMDGNAAPRLTLLRIEKDGAPLHDGILVNGAEAITGVRLVFTQGTGSIRGVVQITNGGLPTGATLSVNAQRKANGKGDDLSSAYASIDDKGRFAIEGLLPGEYELSFSLNWKDDAGGFHATSQPIKEPVSVTVNQPSQVSLTFDLSKREQQ